LQFPSVGISRPVARIFHVEFDKLNKLEMQHGLAASGQNPNTNSHSSSTIQITVAIIQLLSQL